MLLGTSSIFQSRCAEQLPTARALHVGRDPQREYKFHSLQKIE